MDDLSLYAAKHNVFTQKIKSYVLHVLILLRHTFLKDIFLDICWHTVETFNQSISNQVLPLI